MDLAPLVALQDLDARLHALHRRRDGIPRALADSQARVAAAQADLDAYRGRQRASRVDVDRREVDLKALEARIEKLEAQLNQCKTNKEYALLKKEIDGHRAEKGVLDDEILQMMLGLEEKDHEGKAIAATQKETGDALAAATSRAETEIAEVDRQIAALDAERAVAAAKVDADLLRTYERILNGKADHLAVVPVEISGDSGVCQGCYMDITSHEINLLLVGRDVRSCKNCSRILYVVKEPAAPKGKA
jgi:predicted  nucleic acid-binding Zn-ribbon protein